MLSNTSFITPASSPSKAQVLVVDDDPNVLEVVTFALESEGYRVYTARNGMEALKQVEMDRPDIVLLDMRMPVMDGWEFCHRVHEVSVEIPPIMVMSADRHSVRRVEEGAAHDFIRKPINIGELFRKLNKLV